MPFAESIAASGLDRSFTGAALDPDRDASLASLVGCVELKPYEVTRWLAHHERIPLNTIEGGAVGSSEEDELMVLHTPGHTPDSLCLWLEKDRILFTGDTIYPHAAIIVSNKDSSITDYAASIAMLHRFVVERQEAMPQQPAEASASEAGPPNITLACGHVAADLISTALSDVDALMSDVCSGRIEPARSEGTTVFERGVFSVTVRRRPLEACLREAREERHQDAEAAMPNAQSQDQSGSPVVGEKRTRE